MDTPQDDQKLKDEEEVVTTHPSGSEGVPASVESPKENKDILSEHNSIPEVEVSDELKEAGVREIQPTSLSSDLEEHITKATDITPKTTQPSQNNVNSVDSPEKGDIGLGGTWIATLKEKFKGILNRSAAN